MIFFASHKSFTGPTFTSQIILATLWLACLSVALMIPLLIFALHYVDISTAVSSIVALGDLYAPFVGAVLGFFWADRKSSRSGKRHTAASALCAIFVTLIWNAIVLFFLIRVVWISTPLEEATTQAHEIASKLSWLVAPTIGFYFASSDGTDKDK